MAGNSLSGKIVLITGASGALGATVARHFRAMGARVTGVDRIAAEGVESVDLTDLGETQKFIDHLVVASAGIDVVCNIAGAFTMGEKVADLAGGQSWRAMFDTNVRTLLNISAATAPHLVSSRGAMINIGAAAATKGVAGMGAYIASKSCVIRLTETMSQELRSNGVNVNCVLPSIIDTPANRASMPSAEFSDWVSPDDLAKVILFLASGAAKAIHGAAIPVTGML